MTGDNVPDMEISIDREDGIWMSKVYYPGFNIKSHEIAQSESFDEVNKATIEYLENKGWEKAERYETPTPVE